MKKESKIAPTSNRFFYESTNRLSSRFFIDATGGALRPTCSQAQARTETLAAFAAQCRLSRTSTRSLRCFEGKARRARTVAWYAGKATCGPRPRPAFRNASAYRATPGRSPGASPGPHVYGRLQQAGFSEACRTLETSPSPYLSSTEAPGWPFSSSSLRR